MAIDADKVTTANIGDLLDTEVRIPDYQRPYVWSPETALNLLEDIERAWRMSQRSDTPTVTVLGSVILHNRGTHFDIVDGQQRTITLTLLNDLLRQEVEHELSATESALGRVHRALSASVQQLGEKDRADLLHYMRTYCEVVRVETDDLDEAFRVFDSQNYRGKALAPHDLLKAHHLREMGDVSETLQAATVAGWEAADDDKSLPLADLFATYLFRITSWSQDKPALQFTVQDLATFTGFSSHHPDTPVARYHLAAQAILPVLERWEHSRDSSASRDTRHARFQLDAPTPSGHGFFEFVEFMRNELLQLRELPLPAAIWRRTAFASSTATELLRHTRYRKVTELYLASLLYAVNKFGVSEGNRLMSRLFDWAFDLRVELARVQQISIDLHARGRRGSIDYDTPFSLLRHATAPNVLHVLRPNNRQFRDGHEDALHNYLVKGSQR